jgi:hypothetical protein
MVLLSSHILNNGVITVAQSNLTFGYIPEGFEFIGVLSEYCIENLRMKGASYIVSGKVQRLEQDDLRLFTMSLRRIEFMFSPYKVGCFGEGIYFINCAL